MSRSERAALGLVLLILGSVAAVLIGALLVHLFDAGVA